MPKPSNLTIDQVLDALRRQRWRVETTGKNHHRCVPPDPTMPIVVHSSTPQDGRAHHNWIAQLRRSGFRLPRRGA